VSTDFWLRVGIIFLILPFLILLVQYVIRTEWEESETGRAIAWLITTGFLQSVIALLGSYFPEHDFFSYIRSAARVLLGIGLWYLVYMVQKARRESKHQTREDQSSAL
jgi:putative Mn2+ efflux pump MntP